jgi:hypothetical protein
MPYIPKENREKVEKVLESFKELLSSSSLGPGDMNYIITSMFDSYIKELNYSNINQAIGIIECVKLEFYRRIASIYEDVKLEENGDVYKPRTLIKIRKRHTLMLNKKTSDTDAKA